MKSEVKLVISIGAAAVALGIGLLLWSPAVDDIQVGDVKGDARELMAEASATTGQDSAKVYIVEFGDYQCPACKAADPELKEFLDTEIAKEHVKFGFIHFPLTTIHPNARAAGEAVEAAGKQGKYWEMHRLLYDRQEQWATTNTAELFFQGSASELGLNVDQWNSDRNSDTVKGKVERGMAVGQSLGVSSTPTFYVNDQKVTGGQSVQDWKTLVGEALNKATGQ